MPGNYYYDEEANASDADGERDNKRILGEN